MIIAAYAGCGKTTLAKMHEDICVEVASMSYLRILPIENEEVTVDSEREKASEYHVSNPLFPYNIIVEILEAEKIHKYVIIPTVLDVIEILQKEFHRDVILCYPDETLKEEYRERYLKRGNTDRFCRIFADGMANFIDNLRKNESKYHIVLKSGEYLSDKFMECEEVYEKVSKCDIDCDTVCNYDIEVMEKYRGILSERKKNIWLDVMFFMDEVYYKVNDIDDPEERQFIYDFAKRLYELEGVQGVGAYSFDLPKTAERIQHYNIRTVDKMGLLEALERHEENVRMYSAEWLVWS